MLERLLLAAALTAALDHLLGPGREGDPPARRAARLLLLAAHAWLAAGWAEAVPVPFQAYPRELSPERALALWAEGAALAAAGFAAARGRRGALDGLAYALAAAPAAWCASRWPQYARAVELSGYPFAGPFLGAAAAALAAATYALLAAAAVRAPWLPAPRAAFLSAAAAWALLTVGTEGAMRRWWGFGPRSLAEAAGVPTNAEAARGAELWLYRAGGRPYRVLGVRYSSETTDLSPESLAAISRWLHAAEFRGAFAAEGVEALRLGWEQLWAEEEALDAAMISVPGRVHPDYLRALRLIRSGPMSAERYGKLEQLAAATGRRREGFERANRSQEIFEGFSAAYARFGDETNARLWLERIDGLWGVADKKIEGAAVEDLREGRVEGQVVLDGEPAAGLRAGLFFVWYSSASRSTHYWLSGSKTLDGDGRFVFDALGPGRYALALQGPREAFEGRVTGVPGVVEVTYERPAVELVPVRIDRRAPFAPGATAPAWPPEGVEPARAPAPAAPPRPWR